MNPKANPRAPMVYALALIPLAQGCAAETLLGNPEFSDVACSIPQSEILSGGPGKDGIPALTNPTFVSPEEVGTDYLLDGDRVVGIIVDSVPLALPLNIFWWHEIVNLDESVTAISITHCPLTGSTLAFDRSGIPGAGFGVSGLLYRNNLVMYDRPDGESLWPQMLRGARCGPSDGADLAMTPVVEMSWEGWRTLHPDTKVISEATGFRRDYTSYPYGDYDSPGSATLLFPGDVDRRRPPKERTLGIPSGSGGMAFPYGVLDELGAVAAVPGGSPEEPLVVLWDRERQAAMAYRTRLDGMDLAFSVVEGQILDDGTGSRWMVDGRSVDGPMAGRELQAVPEAFVAFWFAWPNFYPDIEIWGGS